MDPKPNQLVTCPFNTAHQVEHYRLQTHLFKCMKQYPQVQSIICPFNTNHIVRREEIDHHVSTCSHRVMMDLDLYVLDSDHRPPVPVVQSNQTFECNENWDEDNVESYNPQAAKKDATIYNKIKGATKSERNKFRFENSVKYSRALNQQGSSSGPGGSQPGASSSGTQ